jgi:K+-transporting ATPase ATPase A chain
MENTMVQYIGYVVILVVLAVPVGVYMAKVMEGKRTFLSPLFLPVEKSIYAFLGIREDAQMDWKRYLAAVLSFSALGLGFVFILQITQAYLGGNPQQLPNVSWDLAFNTAVSFMTNTNWQAYAGEGTLSYLTQCLGLTVQNFLSAATGLAVVYALIRGFAAEHKQGLGNFWVDLTRSIVYILLPLNIIVSLLLVSGGVIQNMNPAETVPLVEPIAVDTAGDVIAGAQIDIASGTVTLHGNRVPDAVIVTKAFVPMGPVASQTAIQQTGTNGGGFMGVNSAHPLVNPTPFTNFIEMLSILLIPAGLCFTFGKAVKNKKQGRAIFAAMFICLMISLSVLAVSEQAGTAQLLQGSNVDISTVQQAGGNMEGKEARFGIASSVTWAAFTTAASNGSVNAALDSLTPLGGLTTMLQIQLGEVIFGGVGSGLYGMLAFAILTVFISGLMIGRTPEFLGKKIEPYEMKWAALICLATPLAILTGSGIATMMPGIAASLGNSGAHGFSELLYAYTSVGGNNGSAFAGFQANTPFINISTGLIMLFSRFLPIWGTLAIAGSLANKKKIAVTAGTLSTTNAMFVFLLIMIVILIGALSFFPALALGPLAEYVTAVL